MRRKKVHKGVILLYAVQFQFNSDRLEIKTQNICIFSDIKELTEAANLYILKEYDISTKQPAIFRKEMALHWARKGNSNEEQTKALIDYMMNNDYSLPFPFIKINEFNEGGNIGKLKPAAIINKNIYYINQLEDGVYNNIIRKIV